MDLVRRLPLVALTGAAMLAGAAGCSAPGNPGKGGNTATIIDAQAAQSRYGVLTLQPRNPNVPESAPTLAFKARRIALPPGYLPAPEISGRFRYASAIGESDLFVAEFETDAIRCPIELRVIEVTTAGARASEPFGNCTLLNTAEVKSGQLRIEPRSWTWPFPDYKTVEPRRRTFIYATGRLTMVYEEPGSASYARGDEVAR